MSKKMTWPDSLELLLDTMCNTFGGIMFIAISLVIISQLISKQQLAKTPEEVNEENLARIRERIVQLQDEILSLQKEVLARQFRRQSHSPDKDAAMNELQMAKQATLAAARSQEHNSIQREAEELRRAHQQASLQTAQQAVASKRRTIKLDKDRNQRHLNETKKNIAELEKILGTLQPRDIRFAMEVATERDPYWVLLQHGRIYRQGGKGAMIYGEVTQRDYLGGDSFCLIPQKGHDIGDNPGASLDLLFKGLNRQRYFISIVLDNDSFASFLTLKQYLRNEGFMVSWSYDPDYEFRYAKKPRYTASE